MVTVMVTVMVTDYETHALFSDPPWRPAYTNMKKSNLPRALLITGGAETSVTFDHRFPYYPHLNSGSDSPKEYLKGLDR
jgi:hypothetical protein